MLSIRRKGNYFNVMVMSQVGSSVLALGQFVVRAQAYSVRAMHAQLILDVSHSEDLLE